MTDEYMPSDITPDMRRANLEASGTVNERGQFEIIPISAGEAIGHGWKFSAEVLRASLEMWDKVEVFVNHTAQMGTGRDVRDLGGMLHSPQWDEANQGPRATLNTFGPSGALITALVREMLSEAEPKPRIGFSADVAFKTQNKDVTQILHVYSVDLVFNPARGGAFVRALNSIAASGEPTGGVIMADEVVNVPQPAAKEANPDLDAIRHLMQVADEQRKLQAEAEKMREVRVQMCAYLLEAGLGASKLPAAAQEMVRAQFTGKAFDATELNTAIDAQRKLVSELTGGQSVAGLSHAREMFSSADQIQAAVDDLFEVERDEAMKKLKVARLSGIRELYHGLTGDLEFHGGYDAQRARFQATTATFPGLVKNAMNKVLVERWNQLGRAGYDWWRKIATVEHFGSLQAITWLIMGTIGDLPEVSEGAEYTELKIGDGAETSTFAKRGGYVGITLEALDRDDTRKIRSIPRELASSAMRNISARCAEIFSAGTYTGPLMADGARLFNNTASTTAGGHANLTSTAFGTDYTAWNALSLLTYNQPMLIAGEAGYYGTGAKMAIEPTIALICRTLKPVAEALFMPRWQINGYNDSAIPPTGSVTFGGKVEPVVVPEWASTTAWMSVVDPVLVPSVMIGERFGLMPEIFIAGDESSPAMFANDESRIKVRHFLAVGVADHRPLGRGNV